MIKAFESLGLRFITSGLGGSEAKAPAANVSMMRFTHNICVTVIGSSEPNKEPSSTIIKAATLMVSWNRMNRWMFWYTERPHITAEVMLLNESSSNVMSLASLATEVPLPMDSPTCA